MYVTDSIAPESETARQLPHWISTIGIAAFQLGYTNVTKDRPFVYLVSLTTGS